VHHDAVLWLGSDTISRRRRAGFTTRNAHPAPKCYRDGWADAGSLIVILLWVYYSAHIVFFGAEVTKVYSRRFGAVVVPARTAVRLTAEARAVQRMYRGKTIERRTRRRGAPGSTKVQ
jgi:hypothetical protein